MGDLSRRAIEPYRTIAGPLSHNGGREKSRKSGAQAALESARRLATWQEAPPISRHGFLEGKRRRGPEVAGGLARGAHRQPPKLCGSITARALIAAHVRGCFSCR